MVFANRLSGRNCWLVNASPQVLQFQRTSAIELTCEACFGCQALDNSPLQLGQIMAGPSGSCSPAGLSPLIAGCRRRRCPAPSARVSRLSLLCETVSLRAGRQLPSEIPLGNKSYLYCLTWGKRESALALIQREILRRLPLPLAHTRHGVPGIGHVVPARDAHLEGLVIDCHYATKLPMMAPKEPIERAHPLRVRRSELRAMKIFHSW